MQPIFTSVNEERVAKQPGGGRMLPKTEFTCKVGCPRADIFKNINFDTDFSGSFFNVETGKN